MPASVSVVASNAAAAVFANPTTPLRWARSDNRGERKKKATQSPTVAAVGATSEPSPSPSLGGLDD